MFTGIIEEIGKIHKIWSSTEGRCFQITAQKILGDLAPDHSIAVSGVCLTVTKTEKSVFEVTVVEETLTRSTLAEMRSGQCVNLERAVKLGDRLGGHLVQGHVDAMGKIMFIKTNGKSKVIEIEIPQNLISYVIEKGSVAVDGASLTITSVHQNRITISVIPYTLEHTTLHLCRIGSRVNIEVDFLGKYVERMLKNLNHPGIRNESWLRSIKNEL